MPEFDEQRELRIVMPSSPIRSPRVFVNGPACLRHRYADGSLCLWWGRDDEARRWVTRDGLYALVQLATEHVYCEALCREGEAWPKAEAPTRHRPRCPACPTSR
ncbi:hypothetical protein AB0L40_09405 [Patulibacter sp. NPDC049589]|uniref:hypothetical protein n=1 Tax=Patulibacter sp. NPDC049589 TaxID=3154731 RepID=UPI00343FE04E